MKTLKRWAVIVGLGLARWGGWQPDVCVPCTKVHLPEGEGLDLAKRVVMQVGEKLADAPGTIKAREAQRMLLNINPQLTARAANWLIEAALQ